jgi:hypothetical protein
MEKNNDKDKMEYIQQLDLLLKPPSREEILAFADKASKNDISSVSVALKKKKGYGNKNSIDVLRDLLEKKKSSDGLNPYSRKLSNYEKNRKNNSGPTATEVIQKHSQLYYGSGLTESNFIEAVEMFKKFKTYDHWGYGYKLDIPTGKVIKYPTA